MQICCGEIVKKFSPRWCRAERDCRRSDLAVEAEPKATLDEEAKSQGRGKS